MAHSLARLLNCPIVTRNGTKPAIRDLLFDDRSWSIRYVIANVGKRFSPRLVAVPAGYLNIPDWAGQIVETNLTFDELARGRAAETVRPVSRQRQLAWNRHFGWRERSGYSSRSIPPAFPRREFREKNSQDDPHLRSCVDLISYQVWDPSGYLGLLEDFIVDDLSWHIGYLLVRAGDWIYRENLVPSSGVAAISWGQGRVVVGRTAHAA